jgi:hypothetical protein
MTAVETWNPWNRFNINSLCVESASTFHQAIRWHAFCYAGQATLAAKPWQNCQNFTALGPTNDPRCPQPTCASWGLRAALVLRGLFAQHKRPVENVINHQLQILRFKLAPSLCFELAPFRMGKRNIMLAFSFFLFFRNNRIQNPGQAHR